VQPQPLSPNDIILWEKHNLLPACNLGSQVDRSTPLTIRLTLGRLFGDECWNLLYRRHWSQHIAPVHTKLLSAHLPVELVGLVLECEQVAPVAEGSASPHWLLGTAVLLQKTYALPAPSAQSESDARQYTELLKDMIDEMVDKLVRRTRSLLFPLPPGIDLVLVYASLEKICEFLEPLSIETDPHLAARLWRELLSILDHVAHNLAMLFPPPSIDHTESLAMLESMRNQQTVCFSQLSSRFPGLLAEEQARVTGEFDIGFDSLVLSNRHSS